MKTNHSSKSGIFNSRVLAAFALLGIGTLLAVVSVASDPATSTISVPTTQNQRVTITWRGSIPPGVNGTSDCTNLADTPLSDEHKPTIIVPTGAYTINPHTKFS